MPEFLIPLVEWLSPLWENPSSFFNFDFLPKYWFYFRQGIIYTLVLSVVSVISGRGPRPCAGVDAAE